MVDEVRYSGRAVEVDQGGWPTVGSITMATTHLASDTASTTTTISRYNYHMWLNQVCHHSTKPPNHTTTPPWHATPRPTTMDHHGRTASHHTAPHRTTSHYITQWTRWQYDLDAETFDGDTEIVVSTDFSAVYEMKDNVGEKCESDSEKDKCRIK